VLRWKPKVRFEDGVAVMLESIDQWGDAPLWTVDKIAHATKDWFRYLGNDDESATDSAQKASR